MQRFAAWARQVLLPPERVSNSGVAQASPYAQAAYYFYIGIVALRYLEVNGLLPDQGRIFSRPEGRFEPQLLPSFLDNLASPGLWRLQQPAAAINYGMLLHRALQQLDLWLPKCSKPETTACRELIERDCLEQVVSKLVVDLPENAWHKQVAIVGWLHQYYHAPEKAAIFAQRRHKQKVGHERIATATQVFTPEWIIRYMVENSLGKLWLAGHPDPQLQSQWQYYLPEAVQPTDVQAYESTHHKKISTIELTELKVLDPCVGSGHILIYAFDLLLGLYLSQGWEPKAAGQAIIRRNLFGLDLDAQAVHIANFALLVKGLECGLPVQALREPTNICAIAASRLSCEAPKELEIQAPEEPMIAQELRLLSEALVDAHEYGSILTMPALHWDALEQWLKKQPPNSKLYRYWLPLYRCGRILGSSYDVVVTNPPYMSISGMSSKLSAKAKEAYPVSKADLFAIFMERGAKFCQPHGYISMVAMQSWLFLSSFRAFRERLLAEQTISTLMHLEHYIMGIAFGTAVTIWRPSCIPNYLSTYHHVRLKDLVETRPLQLPVPGNRFARKNAQSFAQIPGSILAYWLDEAFIKTFQLPTWDTVAKPCQGLATGCNARFLRLWFEVAPDNICWQAHSLQEATLSGKTWFPYNKGGKYRRWYGNNDYLVNWRNNGEEIRNFRDSQHKLRSCLRNVQYYFQPCLTWSLVSTGRISFRYKPAGFIFDVSGMSCFALDTPSENNVKNNETTNRPHISLKVLLALGNSPVADAYLEALAPTINYQVGDIAKIPIKAEGLAIAEIEELVTENIAICKEDWDSWETSWDFQLHPWLKCYNELLASKQKQRPGLNPGLKAVFQHRKQQCLSRATVLQANEERLNTIFIQHYHLGKQLSPRVSPKSLSVRMANADLEARALLSFAIGCYFGRYSFKNSRAITRDGLRPDSQDYRAVNEKQSLGHVLLITKLPAFYHCQALAVLQSFLCQAFGSEQLTENLLFLSQSLSHCVEDVKKTVVDPCTVLQSYWQQTFYPDHLRAYSQCPIYWLVSSGPLQAFQALIYLHGYQPEQLIELLAYAQEQQQELNRQLKQAQANSLSTSYSPNKSNNSQVTALQSQLIELESFLTELQSKINKPPQLDLDLGIAHNYSLFGSILAPII